MAKKILIILGIVLIIVFGGLIAYNIYNESVSYINVELTEASSIDASLVYKNKKITDKNKINSLLEIIENATLYETKEFIVNFGDASPRVEIYLNNGEKKYTILAGENVDVAGEKANLMVKWHKEDESDKTLYKVDTELAEYIEELYNK